MAIPSKLTIAKGIGGAIVATITAFVGLKTLATPTPSQQPGSITAIGGSAVVTGSNNVPTAPTIKSSQVLRAGSATDLEAPSSFSKT
jgi:hypothetical protein